MRLDTCEHWSKMKMKAVVAAEAKRVSTCGERASYPRECDLLKFRDLCGPTPTPRSTRPCVSAKPSVLMTSYSGRAKDGFHYWYRERPKPTSFGRYGTGSYKTVLGIGNAPRT